MPCFSAEGFVRFRIRRPAVGWAWDAAGRSPVLRDKAPPAEYDARAHRYGLTIQNDWIEELERTYGVKL
jgi:hypothetical protein